jgi:hypothetical protein
MTISISRGIVMFLVISPRARISHPSPGEQHPILPPLREGVRGKVIHLTLSLTLPLKGEGIKRESCLRQALRTKYWSPQGGQGERGKIRVGCRQRRLASGEEHPLQPCLIIYKGDLITKIFKPNPCSKVI